MQARAVWAKMTLAISAASAISLHNKSSAAPADPATADKLCGEFTALLRGWAATVTVVSAQMPSAQMPDAQQADPQPQAMTASSFTPVCMEPPTILVCVNKQAGLYQPLIEGQPFCVSLLDEEQSSIATLCSDNDQSAERFTQGDWDSLTLDGQAVPFLARAQARIFCRSSGCMETGTHGIFLGTVATISDTGRTRPLLYANRAYRQLDGTSE